MYIVPFWSLRFGFLYRQIASHYTPSEAPVVDAFLREAHASQHRVNFPE